MSMVNKAILMLRRVRISRSAVTKTATMAIVAVIIIAVIAAGGYYYSAPKGTAVPHPDTLVQTEFGEVQTLDPMWNYESAGGEITEVVYQHLVWYDGEKTDIVGQLAEKWDISPDGLVYTFYLKKGVKFHDGTEFKADAVKFSIDSTILLNDPLGPAWMLSQVIKGGMRYMTSDTYGFTNQTEVDAYLTEESVKVIDNYTVQITLDYAFAPFLSSLAYIPRIVSPAFVEQHGGFSPGIRTEYLHEHTCGTGPYTVVEWKPGERMVLERYDGYWGEKGKMKRVMINYVDEWGTRLLSLFAGDSDCVQANTANAFDLIQKDAWMNNREIVTLKQGYTFRADVSTAITSAFLNIDIKPFDNIKARKGFQYAFNWNYFIDQVYNGFGEQPAGLIPRGVLGHDDSLPKYSYDPARAKQLLLEAKQEGAYEDGQKITLYYNAGNENRRLGCLIMKDSIDALDVGLQIEVQELDWPSYLARSRNHELPFVIIGWIPDYADPDNYIATYAHSKKGLHSQSVGYEDPRIDALIDEAGIETDPVKRAEIYREIQMELIDQAFYFFLCQPMIIHVARDWVKGNYFNPLLSVSANGMLTYWTAWKEPYTTQVAVSLGLIMAHTDELELNLPTFLQ